MKKSTSILVVVFLIIIISIVFNKPKPHIVFDEHPELDTEIPFDQCLPTQGMIDENVFGMHTWGPFQTHPASLSAIDDLGIQWIYNGFHWPSVEVSKDQYDITQYDQFFLEMAQRDIKIVMSIGNYWPTWITDSNELKAEMYEITKLVVERYRPGGAFAQEYNLGQYGVRYWEIINEPNFPCCGWGAHGSQQPSNSALYAEILFAAHKAIREEDRDAVILLGGLSSTKEFIDPLIFIDDIYTYGAGTCFDIVAYHPYGEHNDFVRSLDNIRNILTKHDDEHKPIWFTELGEPDPNKRANVWKHSVSQLEVVPAFFWLGLHDFEGKNETWGVLDGNLQPREPLYSNIKAYTQSLP